MKIYLKQLLLGQVILIFAFACFALSPQARAVCNEGCDTFNGNTFLGDDALMNNTIGGGNTAIGAEALLENTEGIENTANGGGALQFNTRGSFNTATGFRALFDNTTGNLNTATGESALFENTTGSFNTATGFRALFDNTTGTNNTATGFNALFNNTTGSVNTANGFHALYSNTTGTNNTATGFALTSNVTGGGNTAIGYNALASNTNGDFNTAIGVDALSPTIGNGNIAIGWRAGTNHATGDHNIYIASEGTASESNTIRIGRNPFNPSGATTATFIQGISGATVPTGVAVIVDTNGHLGTTTSSARFKDAIKPMDRASEAILALKPVTFHYKKELDPDGIPQFGLVAEEVEKVNPALVARDDQGKPYTVRYEAVNAMLLNEFLKEHRKVEQLTKDFESKLAEQQKQIEALTAGLQKVSAQVEVSRLAPQTVVDNH